MMKQQQIALFIALILTAFFSASCSLVGPSKFSPKRVFSLNLVNEEDVYYALETQYLYLREPEKTKSAVVPSDSNGDGRTKSKIKSEPASDTQTNKDDRVYFADAYQKASGVQKEEIRAEIVYELMTMIDEEHTIIWDRLRVNRGHVTLAGRTLEVLSTIGVVATNGDQAKNIIAAVGSAGPVTAQNVEESYFVEQTLQAVNSAIYTEKARIRTIIENRLKLEIAEYPLSRALRDLGEYWSAGFIHNGLAALNAQVGKNEKDAKNEALNKSLPPTEKVEKLTAEIQENINDLEEASREAARLIEAAKKE